MTPATTAARRLAEPEVTRVPGSERARPASHGRDEPRVCVVAFRLPPEYGGAEIAAFRYAKHLHETGRAPILLAPRREGRTERNDLPSFVRSVPYPDPPGWVERLPGPAGVLARYSWISWRLWPAMYRLRKSFDILHVFNAAPTFNLLTLPPGAILGKPTILDMSLVGSDDPLTVKERGDRKVKVPRPTARWLLYRTASAYVSKSPPLTEAYERSGLPVDRLWEIPYGVDTNVFAPSSSEERRELRRRLGLPVEASVILFLGGINPRKGVHRLLDAFQSVAGRSPDAHLLLVGPTYKYESAYVEGLHARVGEWALADRVHFVEDLVDDPQNYMRAADIFCLPSEREGLPISVLEAMSCGLAVVASDIPEIASSQIRNGEHGLLTPVGDVEALAGALERVVNERDLRDRLASNACHRVQESFSMEVVDGRYRRMYRELHAG